jgi:CRISP-associated protein Cas1
MFGILPYEHDVAPAFVFDLMEPERPKIDRVVLDFVREHVFGPSDFVIRSDGVVPAQSGNGADGVGRLSA